MKWLSSLPALARLRLGEEISIGGFAHPTGISYFLSHLLPPLVKQRRVLYLAKTRKQADWLQQALLFFQPSLSISQWTSAAPGSSLGADVLLVYPDSLDTTIMASRDIQEKTFQVQTGGTMQLSAIIERLVIAGYRCVPRDNGEPGSFTVQGDILHYTVSPTLAFRIHWDYDRIGSIERIGLEHTTIEQLTVYPHSLAGKGTYTILDATRDRLVFREEDTPLPTQRAAVVTLSHFILDQKPHVTQRRLPPTAAGLEELQRILTGIPQVWVSTQFPSAAKKVLSAFPGVHHFDWRETPLPLEGFIDSTEQFVLLTDLDLFGPDCVKQHQATPTVSSNTKSELGAFTLPMTPGDYVVHVYNGIARFTGTTIMEVNGMRRDFLILEYAERDKLYVPVENADRVEKYVGSAHPSVHRLNDATWETAVRHIQEHTLELARQLLDVYAQRELARASQLQPFPQIEHAVEQGFGFGLTTDQQTALEAIQADLGKETPMDRLLCGDVGFGKTEVALRSVARAIGNGFQVGILAPTTILVQQHYDTFVERFEKLGIRVGLLSRFASAAEQKKTIAALREGSIQIVVGTHRLLSKDVQFKKLGLLVIDEEQRFGVKHKELLRKLRLDAHVLTLSATPLPRTLHLALSGVRGISTITTPPPGRLGIESIIAPFDPELVRTGIAHELERKGQVYFLHNDVETIGAKAYELSQWFPKARVGIAHGQLPEEELARIMHAFDTHTVDILVCSTIIENGLDIPNANTLIVERATQFGLAQLHQLRGRIGRGALQAYAYFFYHSRDLTDDAKLRLKALEEAQELGAGFELALRDMEIRGVGSILGKNQHGHAESIGLNYYSRLLSAAVAELRDGKKQTPIRDIPIDLPLPATIPEDVIPDEGERITMYQQFSNIRDRAELIRQRDRWSSQGIEFTHLFQLLEIRLITQDTDIMSIDTHYPNKMNGLPCEKISIKTMQPIPYGQVEMPFERVDERTVRVYKDAMGENWIQTLIRFLEQLSAEYATRNS